ncbi:MAG TPA: hypothetical protein VEH53_07970, partial [archaeon]|nr:hypothetical protein [archaeon]
AGLAFRRGHPVREAPSSTDLRRNLTLGLTLGAAAAGLLILADRVQYTSSPDWPGYGGAAAYFPWLSAAVSRIGGFALRTALILCLALMTDRISGDWTRRKGATAAILVAVGPLILPEGDMSQWYLWLLLGLAMGGYLLWLYVGFLRFDLSLAPILAAMISGLEWVRVVVQGNYPGAAAGGVLGILFMGWLAWWWRGWLSRPST